MYRKILGKLIEWKKNPDKKPLIIKGAVTENYVLEQLKAHERSVYYYANKDQEIDFIYEDSNKIIPIEVKSTKNLNSISFKNIIKRYNIDKGIRYSMLEPQKNDRFIDRPLYSL